MRTIQRTERSRATKTSLPNLPTTNGRIRQHAVGMPFDDEKPIRVRILEHLGGGKLIVDLKGERLVANTPLPLEKNQEIDVIVKNIGNKIILQITSGTQQNINLEQPVAMKPNLGDAISQLIASLESIQSGEAASLLKPDALETMGEALQEVQKLALQIPVDVAGEDLPQQIQNAVNMLGYNYENRLLSAFANGIFSDMDSVSQLKAKLMKLQSALTKKTDPGHNLKTSLLETISDMLESIEFQQLKSAQYWDKSQGIYFQIPFLLEGKVATAEVEFYRPKTDQDQDDSSLNIILNFDLESLGHIEFILSILAKRASCQIRFDDHETCELAKKKLGFLEERLTFLGYDVDAIHCTIGNHDNRFGPSQGTALAQMGIDDIDIKV